MVVFKNLSKYNWILMPFFFIVGWSNTRQFVAFRGWHWEEIVVTLFHVALVHTDVNRFPLVLWTQCWMVYLWVLWVSINFVSISQFLEKIQCKSAINQLFRCFFYPNTFSLLSGETPFLWSFFRWIMKMCSGDANCHRVTELLLVE